MTWRKLARELLILLGCMGFMCLFAFVVVEATSPWVVITEARDFKGSKQYTPPQVYYRWWDSLAKCTKTKGRILTGIRWYTVPVEYLPVRSPRTVDQYFPNSRTVAIAQGFAFNVYGVDTIYSDMFAMHAMAHDMAHAAGDTGHPVRFFNAKCGTPVLPNMN